MIAGSVFCEVLHSEAIHRKHDGTHYKDVTFRRRSVPLVEKNVKQMPVPYMHQDGTFFSLPLMKKKVTQELLPYTGENESAPSCLHGKVSDRGYLKNVNKLCLA